MRLPFFRVIVLVLLATTLPVSASDWLLTAVPQTAGLSGQVLNISKPFQVILTNATNHNLTVWKESCSWGYWNLSFQFKGKDGKIVNVKKDTGVLGPRNFPDELEVLPGSAYTLTVDLLGSKEWTNVEALHGELTMRVIYISSIHEDMLNEQVKSVWLGQVTSDPIPVTIVR
jgi:hypothetical protein